MQLSALVVQ